MQNSIVGSRGYEEALFSKKINTGLNCSERDGEVERAWRVGLWSDRSDSRMHGRPSKGVGTNSKNNAIVITKIFRSEIKAIFAEAADCIHAERTQTEVKTEN